MTIVKNTTNAVLSFVLAVILALTAVAYLSGSATGSAEVTCEMQNSTNVGTVLCKAQSTLTENL